MHDKEEHAAPTGFLAAVENTRNRIIACVVLSVLLALDLVLAGVAIHQTPKQLDPTLGVQAGLVSECYFPRDHFTNHLVYIYILSSCSSDMAPFGETVEEYGPVLLCYEYLPIDRLGGRGLGVGNFNDSSPWQGR